MKKRLLFLVLVFAVWLPVLAIQKPIFMLYHINLAKGCTAIDWLNVIAHGLKLDLAIAGYLTIIPLLCIIVSVWTPTKYLRKVLKIYFFSVISLLSIAFFVDLALYTFWGFRLDATLIFYLQFPGGAMVSMPVLLSIRQAFFSLIYIFASAWLFNRVLYVFPDEPVKRRIPATLSLLLSGSFFLIPIWGSMTTSTSNVGMVYFSDKQFLNHSAINPAFSLIASLLKQLDFSSQFQFFSEEERTEIFQSLLPKENINTADADTTQQRIELLNNKRPDILLILLESFSANVVEVAGGKKDVTPCLNRLAGEGVLFTNIYANSFRTDRGLVSALNGYFAQPTTSIMKYQSKCESLPSLAKSLLAEGYSTDILYGGDIGYTNMHSYFLGSGYNKTVSDIDFPKSSLKNKWGANDDVTFDYMFHSMQEDKKGKNRFSTFLTISSHEPFEVPYHRLKEPYLNSVAFTDSCIGNFIDRLKATSVWDNLLVVFIADHGYRYPSTLTEFEPSRYHIPIIWVGGAVKQPAVIETIASQSDLAATLLSQLDIPCNEFIFSKDILNPRNPAFAFYTFSNGFGFIDESGASAYDNDSNLPVISIPEKGGAERLRKGKALLQTLYDDLGNR